MLSHALGSTANAPSINYLSWLYTENPIKTKFKNIRMSSVLFLAASGKGSRVLCVDT